MVRRRRRRRRRRETCSRLNDYYWGTVVLVSVERYNQAAMVTSFAFDLD